MSAWQGDSRGHTCHSLQWSRNNTSPSFFRTCGKDVFAPKRAETGDNVPPSTREAGSTLVDILYPGGPAWRYAVMVPGTETGGSRFLTKFSGCSWAVPGARPAPYYLAQLEWHLRSLEAPGILTQALCLQHPISFPQSSQGQQSALFPNKFIHFLT